jgi:hypothetical protein
VDDFVILHTNARLLEEYMRRISSFLREKLKIELHPEKSHIIPLRSGITLLGFRVFYYFKLLKKSNQKRVDKKLSKFRKKLERGEITPKRVICSFMGWQGYAKMCNSYKLRLKVRQKIIRLLSELNERPN